MRYCKTPDIARQQVLRDTRHHTLLDAGAAQTEDGAAGVR